VFSMMIDDAVDQRLIRSTLSTDAAVRVAAVTTPRHGRRRCGRCPSMSATSPNKPRC
jgi:hypothetical protein